MIGGNAPTDHGRRRSLDRITHREFRQRNPADVDIDSMSDVTCAFYPECPHGDECSFKHVDCETPGEPEVDADKTPTSAKSGRKVRMRPNSIEVSRHNVPLLITSPTAIPAPSADEREKENRRDSRGWISTKENMKVRPLSIAVPPMTKDVVVTSPTQPFHDTSAKEKLKARPLSIAVPPMRPSYVPTSPTQAKHDTGDDGDDEADGEGDEQEDLHAIETIVLRSHSSSPTPGVETVQMSDVVQSPGAISISA
ncbi:hypothetical protein BD410DRAFT_539934 [Rickenella mellea]|uniref:C3H1-type domain-containing protein n=1 Tax=Rickenella mellea TaxID=50990 RepID=A0A4Y7PRU3_9AGAM|nr:hypothetical protein BD410DRAFT_539934 [Rickenella mellea]